MTATLLRLFVGLNALHKAHSQACGAVSLGMEVQGRVQDSLDRFLNEPIRANNVVARYLERGGFPYRLSAPDRMEYIRFVNSLAQKDMYGLYFGKEDGTFLGIFNGYGFHREPGGDGYDVSNSVMEKHLKSCRDSGTGEPMDCLIPPDTLFVDDVCDNVSGCFESCLQECDDDECTASILCRKYTLKTSEQSENVGLVPFNQFCKGLYGAPTEEPGGAMTLDERGFQTCSYGDGTPVRRRLAGDYSYCGEREICDDNYVGVFNQLAYDPRYRPWYIQTRQLLVPNWSDVYLFTTNILGITHSLPIVDETNGTLVFEGVIATDYALDSIATYLESIYQYSTTLVGIYEDKVPYRLIALSTGSSSSILALKTDQTQPCPPVLEDDQECVPIRLKVENLLNNGSRDSIIAQAHEEHRLAGFPNDFLAISVDEDDVDSNVFVAQTTVYEVEGSNLRWRIIIASPGENSSSDSIVPGNPLFWIIIVLSLFGFAICVLFLVLLYRNRKQRAVVQADWRFTCAFIAGAAFLNITSLGLLGGVSHGTCLLRMWLFHFAFTVMISPLFVKVWRMKVLVGDQVTFHKRSITNSEAALYTLPLMVIQIGILVCFTFVDPSAPFEYTKFEDGLYNHHRICSSSSNAMMITAIVFDTCIVFTGCVLAYQCRNMDDDFGESKQLLFAMYNIAVVMIVAGVVIFIPDVEENGRSLFQAIGTLWMTLFSTASFVLPRLMQLKEQTRRARTSVRISGYDGPSLTTTRSQIPTYMPSQRDKKVNTGPSFPVSKANDLMASAIDAETKGDSDTTDENKDAEPDQIPLGEQDVKEIRSLQKPGGDLQQVMESCSLDDANNDYFT